MRILLLCLLTLLTFADFRPVFYDAFGIRGLDTAKGINNGIIYLMFLFIKFSWVWGFFSEFTSQEVYFV